MLASADIRTMFLDYFRNQDHRIVPSSSLVPHADPSLLFTNAGMVQFKDAFLGLQTLPCNRVASVQRCVRAGGKHNDLENVGYTSRHHTFFEMLGNFSFGDYFKSEAIAYAWEFLIGQLGIDESRLWVTVFDDDDEAADIWLHDLGIPKERLVRCGEHDNFWQMGSVGPCGPCTEIFYDHGAHVAGGPPGSAEADGDRYVEIWNLVFTQYNRNEDGELLPLPAPSVDTGMGLERITAVLQGVDNNYDIDIFQSLIKSIKKLMPGSDANVVSLRVIADHIRSCAFLLSDGVSPSNEGRGYVLRRLIRRAARHGSKLGLSEPFFYKLVTPLVQLMGQAYPQLDENNQAISSVLLQEEQRFSDTLIQGLQHFEAVVKSMSGNVISGEDVFRLYDTYGLPADLTVEIARERELQVDYAGFEDAMKQQRTRARSAAKFDVAPLPLKNITVQTEFVGYELAKECLSASVVALYQDGEAVDVLLAGCVGAVVLDKTVFYAESGGQVSDVGMLSADDVLFAVSEMQKQGGAYLHIGTLQEGELRLNQRLMCQVDRERRACVMRNHSATHLLHAALRSVLGEHVTQKGSLVAADKLRFDFSHDHSITAAELLQVESLVNTHILENQETQVQLMPIEDAKNSGALSLFDEKYSDVVRVLKIAGTFSYELCGGTHVAHAGDIGLMKIVDQSSVAAGVRRLEAVTGIGVLDWGRAGEQQLLELAALLKSDRASLVPRLKQHVEQLSNLEKILLRVQAQQINEASKDIATEVKVIAGVKVGTKVVDGADANMLRDVVDQLKRDLGTAVLVLASVNDNKVTLVAGVTDDITDTFNAGELVNFIARQVGGKGGGRANLAQAGGNNPDTLDAALGTVVEWVGSR